MTAATIHYSGTIFDGVRLLEDHIASFENGILTSVRGSGERPASEDVCELSGDILLRGFVDLQVNGGGGAMLNEAPTVRTIERIANAHRQNGTVRILPTLITDTPEKTTAAIHAAIEAVQCDVDGIAGLHLEGPHLSRARKGAHDGTHIRTMHDADLQELIAAKASLPVLKVTVAPEAVTQAQVTALAEAGILVSLGHTDADYETCMSFARAGATCVTHLFNAMSQLNSRNPGLVGAALDCGALSAGVIADGIHAHPAALRTAWRAKTGPGRLHVVSDSMAVAGTTMTSFHLGGRRVERRDGRLMLADGTLAGADLNLVAAVRLLVEEVGLSLGEAIQSVTTIPAGLVGLPGGLVPGETRLEDVIRMSSDLRTARPVCP